MVCKVGKDCKKLKVGSRVCAVAGGPYKSFYRVHEEGCLVIPDSSAFEEAASWPLSFATAYHAVHEVGHIQSGKSILVQAAGTSIGQAAIQLAQLQGATVIATVSTPQESHAVESLGVDTRHILRDGDSSLPDAISHLTSTKGLDIILNISLTGERLRQLWNTIAASGVLIDTMSGDDASGSSSLDMGPFRRGASYSVLGMETIIQTNTSLVAKTLAGLKQTISEQNIKPLREMAVISSANVAKAFEQAHIQSSLGRVVMTFSPEDRISVPASVPLSLEKNATYLLIGGLGGLGRSLARLLVSNGAQNIAFISRSGDASALAAPLKQELSEKGVRTKIYACDISDEQGMKRVLGQCAEEMPPIRGVLQSAAVLNDAVFENMTLDEWNNSIRPKVQGTQVLHELLPKDLEFFVMLSSISGVIGNRGQANYASGNTFQDGMAAYRRRQGLSAVSVDLGLMLGIGMVAERGGHSNLQKLEAVGIDEPQFHRIMTAAMAGKFKRSTIPSQIISGLPTGGIVYRDEFKFEKPSYFDDPRFAILNKMDVEGVESDDDSAESLDSLLAQCKSLQDASEVTTTALCEKLARGLQTAAGNIDASKPLHAYGVDSLMAVDIRTWAMNEAQAEIALFDVLSATSISGLAKKIASISKATPQGLE